MLAALIVVTAAWLALAAVRANAYVCNLHANTPVNVTVNGKTKIKARSTASCPAATEYKVLTSHLVRVVTILPDVVVASKNDSGIKLNYAANAIGDVLVFL
jgi:quinolinate synthase